MKPSIHRNASLDFISGAWSTLPCCQLSNSTEFISPTGRSTCILLGAGNIETLHTLVTNISTGRLFCIEMSKDVIKSAHRLLAPPPTNLEFIHSVFDNTELPDETADTLFSDCSIALSQDKSAVFEEIYRILKPGGVFVLNDIIADIPPHRLHGFCGIELLTKEVYLELLDGQGFVDITILEESLPRPLKGAQSCNLTSIAIMGKRPTNTDEFGFD